MSLRDLGVFAPLAPDHPMVMDEDRCHYCTRPLTTGVRVVLVPWHTADEIGKSWPDEGTRGGDAVTIGWLLMTGWAGNTAQKVEIIGETRTQTRIRAITRTRLAGRRGWLDAGKTALVPRAAVRTQVPNGYEEVEP